MLYDSLRKEKSISLMDTCGQHGLYVPFSKKLNKLWKSFLAYESTQVSLQFSINLCSRHL